MPTVVVPAAEAAGIVDVAERIERVEAAIVAAARRQHAARSPRAARASATTPACEVARPALDGRTTGTITPAAVIGSALPNGKSHVDDGERVVRSASCSPV
jgi:hypothetical protein